MGPASAICPDKVALQKAGTEMGESHRMCEVSVPSPCAGEASSVGVI